MSQPTPGTSVVSVYDLRTHRRIGQPLKLHGGFADPIGFLSTIAHSYRDSEMPPVFFEVPNGSAIFDNDAVWDIIYPHVSYFTAGSLATAFCKSGLPPGRIYNAFGNQFLGIATGGQAGG